mgnify:CR=1 FL=1
MTADTTAFPREKLSTPEHLLLLHEELLQGLSGKNPGLGQRLAAWQSGEALEDESGFLIALSKEVADFTVALFGVEEEAQARREEIQSESRLRFSARAWLRSLARKLKEASLTLDEEKKFHDLVARLCPLVPGPEDEEGRIARAALALKGLLEKDEATLPCAPGLDGGFLEEAQGLFARAARFYAEDPDKAGVLFRKEPAKADFLNLFKTQETSFGPLPAKENPHHRPRDGFDLTDTRGTRQEALLEAHRCILCHDRGTDFCRKGIRNKDGGHFAENPLKETLNGCPLEEHISEAHALFREGEFIAALALICADNPMVAATGHRICNDCVKSCVHHKTQGVNVPQVETRILAEVLSLPWGFEIYALFTRWNPLRRARPHALPYQGKNVLVAGLGPAGYTLSHYLLNEGYGVVAIDGLKIEPLPKAFLEPVRDFFALTAPLSERIPLGFGGVSEYGITHRWDKNFLLAIYAILSRHPHFQALGGVRMGGTLTAEDAFELGFDHVALAVGAGTPRLPKFAHNLARGVRMASDFLMTLQLSGAMRDDSLANLQIRLPAAVVGGGLTAVDAATELLAYYPVQVEKFTRRAQILMQEMGEEAFFSAFPPKEKPIVQEFLEHGKAIARLRREAEKEGKTPDFLPLLRAWGGVAILYRKALTDSPAYRKNPEEIEKALEEGIVFVENVEPKAALVDEAGALQALCLATLEGEKEIPLRTLLLAAGTLPNTMYAREHPEGFAFEGDFFARFALSDGFGHEKAPPVLKMAPSAPFTSYEKHGRRVSFLGDTHPVYAGSVVKAMASAKDSAPEIARHLERLPARQEPWESFIARVKADLMPEVAEVVRHSPSIVEVAVRAPRQARAFRPGVFYRLQNYETMAPIVEGTRLAMEPLALTGARVFPEEGLIRFMALEVGTSSRLLSRLSPGEPLVVMGPCGEPSDIPAHATTLLVGGGVGNAVLLSIGRAMREAGSRVLCFSGWRKKEDIAPADAIEEAADVVVWAVDPAPEAEPFTPRRPQDKAVLANIVEAMRLYAMGEIGPGEVPFSEVTHALVIGSAGMMQAVAKALSGPLAGHFRQPPEVFASINAPMQCMMKGVCAQCLCRLLSEKDVFACAHQDLPLFAVDFGVLSARLSQNLVQERLASLWLSRVTSQS